MSHINAFNNNEIKTIGEFTMFLTKCEDSTVNALALECKHWIDNGYFAENSPILTLIDHMTGTTTAMDICILIAFEFVKRNALLF